MNQYPNHEWLNDIAKKASENAANKGFRKKEFSTVEACRTLAYMIRQKNLIRGEIGEAYEAVRKGKKPIKDLGLKALDFEKIHGSSGSNYMCLYDEFVKGTLEEELADVAIRALDCAGAIQIKFSEEGDDNIGNWKKEEDFDTIFDFFYTLCDSLYVGDGADWGLDAMLDITEKLREIVLYAFDVATHYNIDLYKHIEYKMNYNTLRPYLHGKTF